MENVNLEGYRKNMTKKEFIENVIDEGECVIRFGFNISNKECTGDCDACWEKVLANIEFQSEYDFDKSVEERKADIKHAVNWAMDKVDDIRPYVSFTLNAPEIKRVAYRKLADAINNRRFEEAIEILRELNK